MVLAVNSQPRHSVPQSRVRTRRLKGGGIGAAVLAPACRGTTRVNPGGSGPRKTGPTLQPPSLCRRAKGCRRQAKGLPAGYPHGTPRSTSRLEKVKRWYWLKRQGLKCPPVRGSLVAVGNGRGRNQRGGRAHRPRPACIEGAPSCCRNVGTDCAARSGSSERPEETRNTRAQ
jgi:hypothetical protein